MEAIQNDIGHAAEALREVGQVVTVATLRRAIVDDCGEWTATHVMVARWYCRTLGAH